MSNNESNGSSASSGGIGFVGLLTIVFIVLKLCKVITWSWLWILSPIWITTAIVILILAIGYTIIHFQNRKRGRK